MPTNNRRNMDKTKKYKIEQAKRKRKANSQKRKKPNISKKEEETNKKSRNRSKNKKMKFSDRHPKLVLLTRIIILLVVLLCVIGAGIGVGIFFGLFGDDFEITKEELSIGSANSVIVDSNGGVIANLSGDEKRKIVSLNDVAAY